MGLQRVGHDWVSFTFMLFSSSSNIKLLRKHCTRLHIALLPIEKPWERICFHKWTLLLVALVSGDLSPGLRSKPGQFPGAASLTSCLPGSVCYSSPPASSPAPRLSVPAEQTQHPVETKADESSVRGRQSPPGPEADPITLTVNGG